MLDHLFSIWGIVNMFVLLMFSGFFIWCGQFYLFDLCVWITHLNHSPLFNYYWEKTPTLYIINLILSERIKLYVYASQTMTITLIIHWSILCSYFMNYLNRVFVLFSILGGLSAYWKSFFSIVVKAKCIIIMATLKNLYR